jgi:hypothetical protein
MKTTMYEIKNTVNENNGVLNNVEKESANWK